MKPSNPLARYEYRLAKEQRRLAVIELRKAEVQAAGDNMDEVLLCRAITTRVMWALVAMFTCIAIASINDVFQNHDDQIQITACERAVTQANLDNADCAAGVIGTVKKK